MNNQELKQLEKWARNILQSDYDKFDIDAELDKKISVEENKTALRGKFKVFLKDVKPTKNEIKTQMEMEQYEQQKEDELQREKIKELQNEEFEKIKNTATSEILEKHFSAVKELTKALIKAKYKKGCWFYGRGGMGKTENTLRALAEMGLQQNKDFVLISGVKSLLSFIKILEANHDKILIVDDDSISKNKDVANILKQALVGGYVQYESERTKINKKFEGKIILISNDTSENADIDAVKSRCFTYNFTLTYKQIMDCLYTFARVDKKYPEITTPKKTEIVDYIKSITNNETQSLTLRAFDDGCEMFLYHKDNWKNILSKLIYSKPEYYLLIQGCEVKEVMLQTGIGERRLYQIKQTLGLTKNGRNQHG